MSYTPNKPYIGNHHQTMVAVGSRITCDPPPMDTDQDWLVFVEQDNYKQLVEGLLENGWSVGGSLVPLDESYRPPQERFNSLKKGVDNIVITDSTVFYTRFLAASSIAKRLNLLRKEDRVALFQAVLYGNHDQILFDSHIPRRMPQMPPMASDNEIIF